MTTDDLWRVALIAAGDDALILFFQALRKPPKKNSYCQAVGMGHQTLGSHSRSAE